MQLLANKLTWSTIGATWNLGLPMLLKNSQALAACGTSSFSACCRDMAAEGEAASSAAAVGSDAEASIQLFIREREVVFRVRRHSLHRGFGTCTPRGGDSGPPHHI